MTDRTDLLTQQFQEFARVQTLQQCIDASQTMTFDTNVIEQEYHPGLLEFWRSLHEPQAAPPPPTPAGGGLST